MSRDIRTCETFDIVLTRLNHDTFHEHDLIRPAAGMNPGCQDIPFEEVEFLRLNIFDKIAVDHGYKVEIIRKVHVWCRNCNSYIGYIKLPYEVMPYNFNQTDPDHEISMQSRTLRCEGCYYHTTIAIRDLMRCH